MIIMIGYADSGFETENTTAVILWVESFFFHASSKEMELLGGRTC